MIKQTQLKFQPGITKDEITARSGLAVYAEFLRGGIKELIDKHMPLHGSNRGYKAKPVRVLRTSRYVLIGFL